MSILFGTFLSGLILTEFIKAASSALHAGHSILTTLPMVILGATWVFFVIFDTLVWQVYSEENPRSPGSPAGVPMEMTVVFLRRSLEFGTLIWLYDIVNILNEIKPRTDLNELGLQSRFSVDLAVILLGWLLWRLAHRCLGDFANHEAKKDWLINVARLMVFSALFFELGFIFSNRLVNDHHAFLLMYSATTTYIYLNYRLNRTYYTNVLPYYAA